MGKKLVKYTLDDGSSVVFETDEPESNESGVSKVARKNKEAPIEEADERFNKVAANIRPAAQVVLDALRGLNSPKEIQLEFGLKFSAKTGVIVASADSEVNFKVSVKWENPGE